MGYGEPDPIPTMYLAGAIIWFEDNSLMMDWEFPKEVQEAIKWSRQFVNWMRGE